MNDSVAKALKDEIRSRENAQPITIDGYTDFIFLNKKGLPMYGAAYSTDFANMVRKYNKHHKEKLPRISPHMLRHTFCTNLALKNMPPKALQYIMGHKDVTTTLGYYAHGSAESAKMAMESLLQAAKEAGCEVMYVSPGMRFGSGSAVFTALAPNGSGEDRNASSLSVLLEHPGFTGVFTGDIGTEQEQELAESGDLARYGAEDVDFYKAAHHGSDYSNSKKFLGMISPKITVVSCGKKNSYGHPGRKALERIQETGSRVFLTMEQGQVCIQPGEEGIRVWTYLP